MYKNVQALCYTPRTNIILYFNYTPKKDIKICGTLLKQSVGGDLWCCFAKNKGLK